MADVSLRRYRGDRLVYVGEGVGGCCASDSFFRRLDAEWSEVAEINIPRWWGLYDCAWFYERTATCHR